MTRRDHAEATPPFPLTTLLVLAALAAAGCERTTAPAATPIQAAAPDVALVAEREADPAFRKLDHVVVIYLENRSFEHRWGLAPLTSRDAAADPLTGAFNFDRDGGD